MGLIRYLTILFLPFFFFACQDDDDGGTSPGGEVMVSFSNLNEGGTYGGELTAQVDARPTESVSQVSLTFAGETVDSTQSTPFKFAIDTRTVADGSHVLEAEATTRAGESVSEDLTINVSNPLAVLELPVSGGDPGFKGYYYGIHDNEGNLLKGGSITLGQEVQVEATQPYPADSVMVSLYYETSEELYIRTFTDADRGASWRMNYDQPQPELADSINIYVTGQSFYGYTASSGIGTTPDVDNNEYTLPATEGTNQYYVTEYVSSGGPRNYEYGTLQDGDTTDHSSLSKTTTTHSVTAPTDILVNVSDAYAYHNDIRKALKIKNILGINNPMEFDLPVDDFSNFVLVGNYSPDIQGNNLGSILTLAHGSTVPSSFGYSTGSATTNATGNTLSGTAQQGDAQAILYQVSDSPGTSHFEWTVSSSGGLEPLTLEAPSIINQKYPELQNVVWEGNYSFVIRSDAISNYREFLDVQRSSIYAYLGDWHYKPSNNLYGEKTILLNPLISQGSELVIKEFDYTD